MPPSRKRRIESRRAAKILLNSVPSVAALLSKDESFSSVYTFLLLLSLFGKDAIPDINGAKLFTKTFVFISMAKAKVFWLWRIAGPNLCIGFQDESNQKDFVESLNDLCSNKILEGRADTKFPGESHEGCGTGYCILVVSSDERSGKLIAFGHRATGKQCNKEVN